MSGGGHEHAGEEKKEGAKRGSLALETIDKIGSWGITKIVNGIRKSIFGVSTLIAAPYYIGKAVVTEPMKAVGDWVGIKKKPGETWIDSIQQGAHKAIEKVIGKGLLGGLTKAAFNIGYSPASVVNATYKRVATGKWNSGFSNSSHGDESGDSGHDPHPAGH